MKRLFVISLIIVSLLLSSCDFVAKPTDRLRSDSLILAKYDSLKAVTEKPWHIGTFVDNFGDPTKEKYVKTTADGYFSNSAVSDRYLFAEVLLKKNVAGIFLHEYDKNDPPVKLIGGFQIQMKNEAGQKIVINSSGEWNQKGGLKITNISDCNESYCLDFSNFRNFIKKSVGVVKVVIFDDYSSVYRFDIDANGFIEEFSKI